MATAAISIDDAGSNRVGNPRPLRGHFGFDSRSESTRAVIAFGIWLRVGFAGASALVIGTTQLLTRELKASYAIMLCLAAIVLMVVAWHYVRISLRRMETQEEASGTRESSSDARRVRKPGAPAASRVDLRYLTPDAIE